MHAVEEALGGGRGAARIHVADERKRDPVLRSVHRDRERAQRPRAIRRAAAFFAQLAVQDAPRRHCDRAAVRIRRLARSLGEANGRVRAFFVVLDHLTDPHNVGAIIRTAECCRRRRRRVAGAPSAGVNATVRKAAAGAAAHLPIARVCQHHRRHPDAEKGRAFGSSEPTPATDAVDLTEADFNRDLALVIGAEGEGLAQLVERECDYLVKIPMRARLSSLNASVAAGVLLYEAVRQSAQAEDKIGSLNRP